MTSNVTRYLELLDQRTALLNSLAVALVAASGNVVSLDIDGLQSRIVDQERLCVDIRSLDVQIDRVQRQCAVQLSVPPEKSLTSGSTLDDQRLRETVLRLRSTQARVQQLNDSHQALLRRSRRTVGALLNSIHSFAMTYAEPSVVCASVGEGS